MSDSGNKARCTIETWVLVYGILNIIVNALSSVCFLGLITYVGIQISDLDRDRPLLPRRVSGNQLILEMFHLLIFTPVALITLLFSTLLTVGVIKRKPALLMTYFVFGLLVTAVSLTGAIFYQVNAEDAKVAAVAYSLILIYALPLILVIKTFKKFRRAAVSQPNYVSLS